MGAHPPRSSSRWGLVGVRRSGLVGGRPRSARDESAVVLPGRLSIVAQVLGDVRDARHQELFHQVQRAVPDFLGRG